tara:strand:- start:47 stop:358 length:312 start_codon:yes stop_codon:yes gene_type:complete
MRDKDGNYLTTKEFFKKWGEGIQKITPLQQVKIQRNSTLLVILGVVIGLFSTFLTKTWWLFIILVGSFFLTIVNYIGITQRLKILKDIDDQFGGYVDLGGNKK